MFMPTTDMRKAVGLAFHFQCGVNLSALVAQTVQLCMGCVCACVCMNVFEACV